MMKRKLFFVFTGVLACLFCYAQTTPPVIFYNQGAVYAKGGANTETSIYIDGGLRAATDGTTSTSEITVELTGIILKGDFLNDVSSGTVFTDPTTVADAGVFEFSGPAAQKISYTGEAAAPTPTKKDNWINFPNLKIDNSSHVTLNARLAAKTKNINLTKGWLIVKSAVASTTLDGASANIASETVFAHLNVDGTVTYNNRTDGTAANRGFIEVEFAAPKDVGPTAKSLIGFGSPFKELRADYFMYNNLREPENGYYSGAGFLMKEAIVNPTTALVAGKGYVFAVDVFGDDASRYIAHEQWQGISFAQRATTGYIFNRNRFVTTAPLNSQYNGTVGSAAFTNETLNTEDIIVEIDTRKGYHYLSNPYTTPLDISELLQVPTTSSENDYEVAALWGGVKVGSLANRPELLNTVWILNTSSVATPVGDTGNKIHYSYNYQVAMAAGGTYLGGTTPDADYDETVIAPLQMFLVYVTPNMPATGKFKIPKDARTMQAVPFLRSDEPVNKRYDDFVLEFKDVDTKTTDRLSVVLRSQDELNKYAYSNVERVTVETDGTVSSSSKEVTQKFGSQVYTKDAAGDPMTVQFFPLETTASIPIYHVPSSQKQALQIIGYRLQTQDKVETLILEDKLKSVKTELLPGEIYETESNPSDPIDRFVLHLKELTGIDSFSGTSIYAYQNGDQIIVSGLLEGDFGGRLELFDVNGKLIASKTVADSSETFNNRFKTGAYFIRLTSDRAQFVKLLVK